MIEQLLQKLVDSMYIYLQEIFETKYVLHPQRFSFDTEKATKFVVLVFCDGRSHCTLDL